MIVTAISHLGTEYNIEEIVWQRHSNERWLLSILLTINPHYHVPYPRCNPYIRIRAQNGRVHHPMAIPSADNEPGNNEAEKLQFLVPDENVASGLRLLIHDDAFSSFPPVEISLSTPLEDHAIF